MYEYFSSCCFQTLMKYLLPVNFLIFLINILEGHNQNLNRIVLDLDCSKGEHNHTNPQELIKVNAPLHK